MMVKTQRIVQEERISVEMQKLKLRYFGDQSLEMPTPVPVLPTYQGYAHGSSMWKGITLALSRVANKCPWLVGDGRDIDIWRDSWGSWPSIKDSLPTLKDWKNTKNFLSEMIVEGFWVVNESMAPVLAQDAESVDHLLWTCSKAQKLWKWFANLFQSSCPDLNLKNMLQRSLSFSSYLGDLCLGVGSMQNCIFDLQIIAKLGVLSKVGKPSRVRSVYWSLPEPGEVKINTDGAALGNPGKGGAGAVFRVSDGEVLGAISVGLPIVTNFIAECSAIIKSLEHCSNMGWEIAWVEGDSVAAIQAFSNDAIPWVLDGRWKIVKKKI
ncbi:hypothetical protein GIB67_035345 [Kingdonia uniflora]|uniref:RNase H type-1 domain-containing protein n=1 Tax=Kingdonia uniflora TaxID=39325 RepID=A0A7J7LYH9_9MAGN|nr:hypothetical protein GIB67_035345 [Kingdonia uniflora]